MAIAIPSLFNSLKIKQLARFELGAPAFLLIIMAMMILPLPPILLDVFFTFNIALSLMVLLVVVYSAQPLEFAVFPVVLLLSTLLRLALNIASTRVVLLEGHTGAGAAGQVIQAFGEFVIGGNYAVGLVVFSILVIINFVVVTKGAGRISEVTARFTLDAMPGKQMAIDADLNAGIVTQEEAKERREYVGREADFYGSMDGASKFVRGDAVAGILILMINLIGGFAIGMLQHGMNFSDATRVYTLLTIGDGLVAQIPSLMLSTATAVMVTRASDDDDVGHQVLGQLFADFKALYVTAAVVGVLGLIPGMPNVPFLSLAAILAGIGYTTARSRAATADEESALEAQAVEPAEEESKELSWDDVQPVDVVGLEVGYRLIPLVDRNQGGELMSRIKGVRKKLTQELGFLIPVVHIRDNLELSPNVYRVLLNGVIAGEAEIYPDRDIAINPGQVFGELEGIATIDPAFGLQAVWIDPLLREQAQTMGYTVVDAGTVIATHLSQLLKDHATELLGREETQKMFDNLAKVAPKLVEELIPNQLSLGVVVAVLQTLLQENIPIRDIRSIAEALAEYAPKSQDPGMLTAYVRTRLSRAIVEQLYGFSGELEVCTLHPDLERILRQTVQVSEGGGVLEPGLAEQLNRALVETSQRQIAAGKPSVLLVSAPIRPVLAQFVRHTGAEMSVLSFDEIPDNRRIKIVANVGGDAPQLESQAT